MKIRKQYQEKFIKLSQNVSRLFGQLGYIEYSLQMLNSSKQELLEQIKKNNNQSQMLEQSILKQYGEGYINPQTFEFVNAEVAKSSINQEK